MAELSSGKLRHNQTTRSRFTLEGELQRELEGAWPARSEHARGARNGREERAAKPFLIQYLIDVRLIAIVGYIEEVKDLTNQIEAPALAEPDTLGHAQVLRDERVAADGRSRRKLCDADDRIAKQIAPTRRAGSTARHSARRDA